ncbi:MAG: hypothetical protein ACK58T_00835, partial [Phycisphaerae bacterium]
MLLIPYDDLNGVLDRLHARLNGKTPLESFQKIRLVDHLDAIFASLVPRLVDSALNKSDPSDPLLSDDAKKLIKKIDPGSRRDLLLLQSVYDRPDQADLRTTQLRRKLGLWLPWSRVLSHAAVWLGWIP